MVVRTKQGGFLGSFDLRGIEVRNHVLTPAEAEVRVTFALRGPLPAVEVRGRLVGPRCRYASTVEVAYPFRSLPHQGPSTAAARVIIPEPSLWEPACPFLYQGSIELWAQRQQVYAFSLTHGLRSVQLGPQGLRWNGQGLPLRGAVTEQLADAEALALRQGGYNTLLVGWPRWNDALPGAAVLCAAADRLGFLVLAAVPSSGEAILLLQGLADHAGFLGWLLPEELVEQESLRAAAVAALGNRPGCLLGAALTRPLSEEQLTGIAFVCCREEVLPELEAVQRPKLLLTERETLSEGPSAVPGILGWVRV